MARTPDAPRPESADERSSRRPLLRRAWIAWVVALLLALASVGIVLRVQGETDDLRGETAGVREELEDVRSNIRLREQAIRDHRDDVESLTEALETCARAIDAQLGVLTKWIDHLAASRDRNFDLAEQIYDEIDPVLRDANRTLRRCDNRAVDEGAA